MAKNIKENLNICESKPTSESTVAVGKTLPSPNHCVSTSLIEFYNDDKRGGWPMFRPHLSLDYRKL